MSESRTIPWQIADRVTLWARARGRTARMYWQGPPLDCAVIELSCHPDDPKQVLYREGKLAHPPTEPVWLHYYDAEAKRYRALDLDEYGAEGIIGWLEEQDVQSGRGQHETLYHSVLATVNANEAKRAEHARAVEEAARESAWLHRRGVLDLPAVPVGIDLGAAHEERHPETQTSEDAP